MPNYTSYPTRATDKSRRSRKGMRNSVFASNKKITKARRKADRAAKQ